jgi:hypothetical protein
MLVLGRPRLFGAEGRAIVEREADLSGGGVNGKQHG